jgi:chromosome segregation ATPase
MYLKYFYNKKINSYGDRILSVHTKWPIFFINKKNKKSVWHKIQERIEELSTDVENLQNEIDNFLDSNPEIEFEIEFFNNEMPEIFFLK